MQRQEQSWSSQSCWSSARAMSWCRQSQPCSFHTCRCCDLLASSRPHCPLLELLALHYPGCFLAEGQEGSGPLCFAMSWACSQTTARTARTGTECVLLWPAGQLCHLFYMSYQEVCSGFICYVSSANCNFNINTDTCRQGENTSFWKKSSQE